MARRPRAILYDDDPAVLDVLAAYFELRDYNVLAFREPVFCAVYRNGEGCDRERACADVMITDYQMPGMDGVSLLAAQALRGCPLTPMNKAVLSGGLDAAALEAIRRLGCASFLKPVRLAQLEEWVRECEFRTDLTRPLGALRREPRSPCAGVRVALGPAGGEGFAEVVNRSPSGICLRLDREPGEAEEIEMRDLAVPPKRLLIRWTKPGGDGRYLVGAAYA